MSSALADLEVLIVDCQATAAAPRGHLLELGWLRLDGRGQPPSARIVRLPDGAHVPMAVARITGITDEVASQGVTSTDAWAALATEAAALARRPSPAVAHYARFERPFLQQLAGEAGTLDLICTHDIACRLLPDLPRRSLRALTGYFGRAVGTMRRSTEHVEATAFVWRHLVALLEPHGITTWEELRAWLDRPCPQPARRRRGWPMPREVRLAVPDAPGIYRMLRTNGDVLYVGKASSLRHRVNSYFRKQRGIHERTLEMLSQARGLSVEVTPSALEAALRESDEIKRHRPPYNVALLEEERRSWFASPDLSQREPTASRACPVGPFSSAETLEQFVAMTRRDPVALGPARWGPDSPTFEAGWARLLATHPELSEPRWPPHVAVFRLGVRLWREGRRDRDKDREDIEPFALEAPRWSPELVEAGLEWVALRAVVARRRARWLTRLVDATVVWAEPATAAWRSLTIEDGEIVAIVDAEPGTIPAVPRGAGRSRADRQAGFSVARYDRLRVLTTELKRILTEGGHAAVRFGPSSLLTGDRLAAVLARV